jgi:uncharacterized membrane protein
MKGKIARPVFIGVCVGLAILLLAQVITPIVAGAIFALALAVLGGFSRGFRRR